MPQRKLPAASKAARRGPRAKRSLALAPPRLDLDLLAELSNASAVSGDEAAVRRLVLEAIRPYAAEVRVDALGNVLAVKPAAGVRQPPRVLVAAHMDEVGLMIVDHDGDGALRFEVVGGLNERLLLGKPVWVGPKRVPGVIGATPIHLLTAERRHSVARAGQLRIDIGAASQEAARRQVAVGERATFATEFAVLDGALRGKALDNRIGCAALIALLRGGPYPVTLQAAFTVQEEVGLRGAQVAGFALAPDAALALDCAPAHDLPDSSGRENTQYNARLGCGPVIYRSDGRSIGDKRLVAHLVRTAEANDLPYQFRQPGGGGTDAGAIQRVRGGVPVVSVSVPARYLHGPAALARTADAEQLLRLVHLALANWTSAVLKDR